MCRAELWGGQSTEVTGQLALQMRADEEGRDLEMEEGAETRAWGRWTEGDSGKEAGRLRWAVLWG